MDEDPTNRYLEWARDSPEPEHELRKQVLARLPTQIVDVHCHANGAGAVGIISEFGWRQVRSSFPSWSIEHSDEMRVTLFGDRLVRALRIAQPYRGIDHRKANGYLLQNSHSHDAVALCGLLDDISYTMEELRSGQYAALKMYPFFREPPYAELSDFFPDELVLEASRLGTPLIVHLATPLSTCTGDVVELALKAAGCTVILAHNGREQSASGAASLAFRRIASLPNVVVDCSMATAADVYALIFDTLGPSRVLYGSDEPMNLLRMMPFNHPQRGLRFVSPMRYHWLEAEMHAGFRHLAADCSLMHWQVLQSVLNEVDRSFGPEAASIIDGIFFKNAQQWVPAFAT